MCAAFRDRLDTNRLDPVSHGARLSPALPLRSIQTQADVFFCKVHRSFSGLVRNAMDVFSKQLHTLNL